MDQDKSVDQGTKADTSSVVSKDKTIKKTHKKVYKRF